MAKLSSWRSIGALLAVASSGCDRSAEQRILFQPSAETVARSGRLRVPPQRSKRSWEHAAPAQRCKRTGPGLEFSSQSSVLGTRAEWSHELNGIECTRGVDEGALRTCLTEL